LLATACGPDTPTGPTGPDWVTTQVARTTTATSITNYVGAWTDDDWAATLEVTTVTGGGGSAAVLFSPRSGPGRSVLGTPQRVTPSVSPSLAGPLGEHLVGVAGNVGLAPSVEIFRETAGVWASAAVVTLATDESIAAMSDEWLITRTLAINPGAEAHAYARPIDASGPTIVVGAPQTLSGDPAWPLALREGFGGPGAAVDGGLLVVGAQGQFTPTPGGARVFRDTGGSWTPVLSLGDQPGGPNGFARALAVDDGATVDRIAYGPATDGLPVVEVLADSGSGFAPEQTLSATPGQPDVYSGLLFGNALALDGDLLAVSSRGVTVPSATPGHADVKVGYVQLFRRGATWAPEAEVPLFTTPASAGVVSALPFKLQASGNHVAAFLFVSPDPPPGCVFPCFNFGFEAWSIDDRNG